MRIPGGRPVAAGILLLLAGPLLGQVSFTPLTEMGPGAYLGLPGGLYPGGRNVPPAAHASAGAAHAAAIRPLDPSGNPRASGKIALLSIWMSNTTQEFCSTGGQPGSCESTSFIAQATNDAAVNHSTLVLVNGAAGGKSAEFWTSPSLPDYDRILSEWLTPLGLSEKQVEIVWLKVANPQPHLSLPDTAADDTCSSARSARSRARSRLATPICSRSF